MGWGQQATRGPHGASVAIEEGMSARRLVPVKGQEQQVVNPQEVVKSAAAATVVSELLTRNTK